MQDQNFTRVMQYCNCQQTHYHRPKGYCSLGKFFIFLGKD